MRLFLILLVWLPSLAGAAVYQWRGLDSAASEIKSADLSPGYSFYKVAKVYDGDTVELEDGRKVRLLGINAPEVEHHGKTAEAGGDAAKRWLTDKLKNSSVRLEISPEKTDKYGRTLAHLFTENQEHINVQLVKAGLAVVNLYPPNPLYADALLAAEQQAERGNLGIWGLPDYAAIPVSALTETGRAGWTRLTGKVQAIRHSKHSVYLQLSDLFEARIERRWLSLYPDVDDYQGKTVEVRGWMTNHKHRLEMLVRYPSAIKILD